MIWQRRHAEWKGPLTRERWCDDYADRQLSMRSIVQLLQISETAQEESIHSRGSENKQPALAQPCRVCQTSPCISCFCHNNLSVRRRRGAACSPGLKRLQRPTSLERLLRSPDPSHGVSGAVPVATQKVPDANLGGRTAAGGFFTNWSMREAPNLSVNFNSEKQI